VRVGSHHATEVLRALDIGAQGIIVPHVNTQAEAEAIVRAAHYPPIGRRGLATTTRAGQHAFSNLKEHLSSTGQHTLIAVQVEDPEGIEHVDAIASVPHIDCVFIGPTDLSLGLGYPGENDHPAVIEAFARIHRAVNSKPHVKLGTFARDSNDANRWTKQGASFSGFGFYTPDCAKLPRDNRSVTLRQLLNRVPMPCLGFSSNLAKRGFSTIQTLGFASVESELNEAEAVVVALKSRSVPAADATKLSLEALQWLQSDVRR
jgi:hypothetical protein